MDIQNLIQIWNQVMVRVLDVRLKRAGVDDDFHQYRLPASAFLFAWQGQGEFGRYVTIIGCSRFDPSLMSRRL